MTAKQIEKALIKAGYDMSSVAEISRDEVEIFVNRGDGVADYDATDAAVKAAYKALPVLKGGYSTGYGAWVLQTNPIDKGDYCDASSLWHY